MARADKFKEINNKKGIKKYFMKPPKIKLLVKVFWFKFSNILQTSSKKVKFFVKNLKNKDLNLFD